MSRNFATLLVNLPIPSCIRNKEYKVPTSLLYLASYLERANEHVDILDMNIHKPWDKNYDHSEDECYQILYDAIIETKPKLIGFGCIFSGLFPVILGFSKFIKAHFPETRIVTGGVHSTLFPHEILQNCPSIDYVIMGEGERQLLELVRALKNGGTDIGRVENGFAYRDGGKVIVKNQVHYIENLDASPFPAYSKVDFGSYRMDMSHWRNPKKLQFDISIPIITSRSCPNQCNFCSVSLLMGKKFRYRSASNVVEEIEHLYHTYNIRHLQFYDDNFTFMKKRAIDICNEIVRRNLNIHFENPGGLMVARVDDDIIDAMASAGWTIGTLAIESGSEYIRNSIMGKKLSNDKIHEVVESIRRYPHIRITSVFIVGLPEDTRETLMETYNMLKELDLDHAYISNAVPYPGTRLFDQCVRDNLLLDFDPATVWFDSALYAHPDNWRFHLKPYKLEMEDLRHYRKQLDELVDKMSKRKVRTAPGAGASGTDPSMKWC